MGQAIADGGTASHETERHHAVVQLRTHSDHIRLRYLAGGEKCEKWPRGFARGSMVDALCDSGRADQLGAFSAPFGFGRGGGGLYSGDQRESLLRNDDLAAVRRAGTVCAASLAGHVDFLVQNARWKIQGSGVRPRRVARHAVWTSGSDGRSTATPCGSWLGETADASIRVQQLLRARRAARQHRHGSVPGSLLFFERAVGFFPVLYFSTPLQAGMAGSDSAGTAVLHSESRGAESLDRCPVYRALYRGLSVDSATVRARGAHGALLCGSASGSDAPYEATHGLVYRGCAARNGCDRGPGVLRFSCLASREATVSRKRLGGLILVGCSRPQALWINGQSINAGLSLSGLPRTVARLPRSKR